MFSLLVVYACCGRGVAPTQMLGDAERATSRSSTVMRHAKATSVMDGNPRHFETSHA